MKIIKKINTLLSILLFIGFSLGTYAQLQNSHWYFGDKAGLKFNKETLTPSVMSNNYLMETNGGSASISDNDGNLLFYTDGITVWNRNHEVMPNGTGLFGSSTVSQSVIIVPKEDDQFYIFSNQAHDLDSHGLSYSIVNMTGDNDNSGGNDNDNDDYEYCNNNQSKIYICHNGNTICVNINAKDAHLAHGDSLGKCDDNDDDDEQDNDDDDDVSSSGSKLKTGVITGVTSDWKTVSLSRTYNSMVVIATPNYTLASEDPMVVRIRNASGNSFQVRADSPGGTVSAIDIHYVVVEEGVYEGMEAVKYNSTVTDQNNSWIGETRSYQNSYSNPVVLGQVMTFNDEGFSTFWAYGNSRANPPSATKLNTGKSVAEDKDTSRNDETIGYIVIESGSGIIDGISYAAAVGSDIITHAEKNYTINHANAVVAIATITAMDGTNGGWAVLSSDTPVSETSLKLSIDEDIIGDKETAHTTEQVAYIVFSSEGSYSNDNEDNDDDSNDDNDDNDDHGSSELGYVISGSKNTQLLPFTSEKLTVIANPNDDSYWVVSFAPSIDHNVSDTFYTFKVDENGVTLFNESTFAFPFAPNTEYSGGQMKISPDATALALAHNTVDRHERYGIQNYTSLFSFDFDSTTGKISSYNQEFIANDLNFYGIEFSPNSKLLYVTGTHIMSDANAYPIKAKEVGRLYQIPFRQTSQNNMGEVLYEGTRPLFGLQLGLDEKIYVVNASGNLSVINSPNTEGFDANFEFEKIDLNGKARRELPQAVPIIPEKADKAPTGKSYEILENPVKLNFKIKFTVKDSYTVEFYSSMGINIKHISFKGAEKNKLYEVRAEDLTPGIYFLTIKDTKSNVWEETIIKQ